MDKNDKPDGLNAADEAEYLRGLAAGESDGYDSGCVDGYNYIEAPLPDDEGSSEAMSSLETPSFYDLGYSDGLPLGYHRGFKAGLQAKRES